MSTPFPEVRLKTTWVRTVPDEWDADDTKGTLEFGDILGDAFFTAYEDGKTWHVIKVSLVDGRTLWDQAMPPLPNKRDHDVEGLRAGKEFLYVTSGDYLHVINPEGGKLIARYGAQ